MPIDNRTFSLKHNKQLFKSLSELYRGQLQYVTYTVDEELLGHTVLQQPLNHLQGFALQVKLLSERLFNSFPPANITLHVTRVTLITILTYHIKCYSKTVQLK